MRVIARDALFWGMQDHACEPVGIPTRMIYSTGDPYAVKLIFGHRSGLKRREQVEWVFARDLLATGMYEQAGEGDVRLGPIDEVSEMAALTLIGHETQATLLVAKMAITEFLELTYGLCALGDESQFSSPHA